MWSPDGTLVLAYNGEVYNYRELRRRLEGQWRFSTEGDTEVVLAGLALEGPAFLDRMEGMWAIALWNTRNGELLLARDRMGKKPLFYSIARGGFACASELPTLKRLAGEDWHEDEDSTADYLRYGYCLPGYTAWREVREVLPGHYLRWRAGEPRADEQAFWRLERRVFAGSPVEAAGRLREALVEAVRRRLVADVEVGAFLSGGVDSSLVCAIVTRELGLPIRSFTIGFPDPAYDEREFAARAAREFGTDHHADVLDGFSAQDLERLLLDHVGAPFHDSSLLPTALVCQVAARRVKVALSGDGGDELFGGYGRYQARMFLRWYTRLPQSMRLAFRKSISTLPEPEGHRRWALLKTAHLFCDVAERLEEESPYVAPIMFQQTLRDRLAPDLAGRGHEPPGLPVSTETDDVAGMMSADALVYLPQDILTKVDRASMAASLEARAPFLDRDVVELAFSLPRPWHRGHRSAKHMLRRAFGDLLPDWLWTRPKQGFGVPLHAWFRGDLGDSLRQLLGEGSCGPLRPEGVFELLDQHVSGRRDLGHRLWLLYAYLLWKNRAT